MSQSPRVRVFGIEIQDIDLGAVKSLITKWIDFNDKPRIVVTPNVDHLIRIKKNYVAEAVANKVDLVSVYNSADLCVNDSNVLRKLLKLRNIRLSNVCAGSDLTEWLFASGLIKKNRTLIVGLDDDCMERLCDRYQMNDYVHYNPPMRFIYMPEEVRKVVDIAVGDDFKFIVLAVGSPRQEVLAHLIKQKTRRFPIILCAGASLDFLSGKEIRAPKFIRKLGFEWLWRGLGSPKRLGMRYLRLIGNIGLILRDKG